MNFKFVFKIVVIALLVMAVPVSADQAPGIEWQKVIGGSAFDWANDIVQTADGGYILAGRTFSSNDGDVGLNHGGQDVWVVKLDSNGMIEWQKVFGGEGEYDSAESIIQTADGGYIFTGYTTSSNSGDVGLNHGGADIWVVKLDGIGNIQWQNVIGGSYEEWGHSICQAPDGGYIIAGWTTSSNSGDVGVNHGGPQHQDAWVVKLDSTGNIQWQKVIGGNYADAAFKIVQTTDGGYIFTGQTWSGSLSELGVPFSQDNAWVVKLDSKGDVQWQRVLGGSGLDRAWSIIQSTDGGYALTGYTESDASGHVSGSHGYRDIWVVKLDGNGNIEWERCLGGEDTEMGIDIVQATDGGYIIAGLIDISNSFTGTSSLYKSTQLTPAGDILVAKLDGKGNVQWQKILGGKEGDAASGIIQTTDGGLVITGGTRSSTSGDVGENHGSTDIWTVKLGGISFGTHPLGLVQGALGLPKNPVTETITAIATVLVGIALTAVGSSFSGYSGANTTLDLAYRRIISRVFDFIKKFVGFRSIAVLGSHEAKFRNLQPVERSAFLLGFSLQELIILFISVVLFSGAFFLAGQLRIDVVALALFLIMGAAAVIGHELVTNLAARSSGCNSEFQFWGLGTAILYLNAWIFGLVFGKPSRTIMDGIQALPQQKIRKLMLIGPLVNVVFAVVSYLMIQIGGILGLAGSIGLPLNILIAVFTLVPVSPMKGKILYDLNRYVWALLFVPLVIFYIGAVLLV